MAVMVQQQGEEAAGAPKTAGPSAWLALLILGVVYALNYLDRTLIYILFPKIKAEFAFDDFQLALLGSTSFVIFYTLLGVPFGRLADRVSRTYMVAVGLGIWSLFSGLTGWMESFWGIFFCRVMVGVGEATLGPAALSLLADRFPARMRATAGALYSTGIPIGAGLALFVGGWFGQNHGWREAFWYLGFPGLAMVLAVLALGRDTRVPVAAPAASASAAAEGAPSVERPWATVLGSPVLRLHIVGYAFFALATNALSMWMPTFFSHAFSMDLAGVGKWTGGAAVIGGLLGTSSGGWAADQWKQVRRGGRLYTCAVAAALCAGLWATMLFSPNFYVSIACYTLLMAAGLMWLGPAVADLQDITGPKLQGFGVGVYFLVVNAVGYGFGPPLIGKLNDLAGVKDNPLAVQYSLLLCPAACVVAAVLLFFAGRRLDAR